MSLCGDIFRVSSQDATWSKEMASYSVALLSLPKRTSSPFGTENIILKNKGDRKKVCWHCVLGSSEVAPVFTAVTSLRGGRSKEAGRLNRQ